jgi:hypothetical protein
LLVWEIPVIDFAKLFKSVLIHSLTDLTKALASQHLPETLLLLKTWTILLWQSVGRVEIIGANLLTHSILMLAERSFEVLKASNPERLSEMVTLTSAEDANAAPHKSKSTKMALRFRKRSYIVNIFDLYLCLL